MRKLIPSSKWLKSTVTEQEASAFNPNLGPCCDRANFRVHLDGTPCDAWNKSATSVFVDDFLTAHPEYPSQDELVRNMVRAKSRAFLESMIRDYRRSKAGLNATELEEARVQKNRRERKRKVSSVSRRTSSRFR